MNILTPTGYKDINDVNIGDQICAFDVHGAPVLNTLLKKESIDAAWMLEAGLQDEWVWYLINGDKKFFRNQSIWANGNLIHAYMVQVGDIIYDEDNNPVPVLTMTETTADQYWWKLSVSGDHGYISSDTFLHNADRYWVGGGSAVTWAATANTNWAATSGGANNASVPGSSDNANFDSNSNSANTIGATITVGAWLATSGYTATTTRSAVITVAGSVTLSANATYGGASGMTITAASTMTANGKLWTNALTTTGAFTRTLADNWTVGLLTQNTANAVTNGNTLTVNGGLTVTATQAAGTTLINLTGGTWSGDFGVANNLTLTPSTSDITVSGSVRISAITLTKAAGAFTVITTSSTLVLLAGAQTLDTSGVSWNNISIASSATTKTINSMLTVTGTLSLSPNATFAGTTGFTAAVVVFSSVDGATLTFKNSITYTITTSFTRDATLNLNAQTITSDHASLRANIVLSPGCTIALGYLNATRINSAGGRTVNTFSGTITDCVNWQTFTDLKTVGFAS